MNNHFPDELAKKSRLQNGAGAAAHLSAGVGSFALAGAAIIGDHSLAFKRLMTVYTPTGPLSGVTTTAIAVWLACWVGLDLLWRRRDVPGWFAIAGLWLIALSFLLMFPPIGDLF